MENKDFRQQDKKQQPQAREQHQGGRKNEEEVGEPVQLNDDKMEQDQSKPGMGRREGQHDDQQRGGQHQGGQHQGGQHQTNR
jgi:hypothetical protein